jgi:hypothetical protein
MSVGRLSLLIGILLATSAVSVVAAGTLPWRVAVRSQKPHGASGQLGFHVRMAVNLVAGGRQPQALALRLVVRRNSQYARGWFGYQILCGGWRHCGRTAMGVKTPLTVQIPFRTPRAGFCTIDAGGNGLSSSDDPTLDLLCRAKSRSWCVPIKPD